MKELKCNIILFIKKKHSRKKKNEIDRKALSKIFEF